jgi:hypothetical protein
VITGREVADTAELPRLIRCSLMVLAIANRQNLVDQAGAREDVAVIVGQGCLHRDVEPDAP